MAFDYSDAIATANSLIADFGGAGSVVKKGTTGGFDSEGNPKADVADVVIEGVITPIVKYKNHEVDGSKIIVGDGWVFFDAEEKIETDMQTTINGQTFRIISVGTLSSVEGAVVYQKLQLRG